MKLSVVYNPNTKDNDWALWRLSEAARELGVQWQAMPVLLSETNWQWVDELGDVVYYWGVGQAQGVDRMMIKKRIAARRVLINKVMMEQPFLVCKSYQQMVMQNEAKVLGILTRRFMYQEQLMRAVETGELKLPFIQKPDVGSLGKNVSLVQNLAEVSVNNINKYIYQPYLPNDGDYRVLVVGGQIVGMVKRIAALGKIVNNLSQGGDGVQVKEVDLLKQAKEITDAILRILPFDVVGVDLIRPKGSRQLVFLEVNSVPRWEHFEKITGLDVASAIVRQVKILG